jgi:hypothetical protein
LNFKTEFGKAIAIVGDIPQLGHWKDLSIGCMRWNEGNDWRLTVKGLPIGEPFQYKYVLIDHGSKQAIQWEDGFNRICDPAYLKPLKSLENNGASTDCSTFEEESAGQSPGSRARLLTDEWEHFTVTFSIYYPGQSDLEVMRINGDTTKLGNWNKGEGPLVMGRGSPRQWLTGEEVSPWEMPKVRFAHSYMPHRLIYKYSLWNEKEDYIIWEREPSRVLQILDPSEYEKFKKFGQLQTSSDLEWRNCD